MALAARETRLRAVGLQAALERWLRPAIGFSHPLDVLKDPGLGPEDKRSVLSSWASDASAVKDQPTLRWLLGTPAPVPLVEVREALARLDAENLRRADPRAELTKAHRRLRPPRAHLDG